MPKAFAGVFAPKLTSEGLERYKSLAKSELISRRSREYMESLIAMLELFWQTPESTLPSEGDLIVPLEEAEIQRIWDAVPWMDECDVIGKEFEKIPAAGATTEIRNAAFHLLWYARELTLDREPRTKDKLPSNLR